MPVFTLQAISVKGRLMAMGGTVKSVNTGGITFATGENPRFLPQKQNSKNSRPAPLVSSDSPLGQYRQQQVVWQCFWRERVQLRALTLFLPLRGERATSCLSTDFGSLQRVAQSLTSHTP